MLLNHPNIERVRFHEHVTSAGATDNTLIIETNLSLPKPGQNKKCQHLSALLEYLTSLHKTEFGDFDRLEIREFKTREGLEKTAQIA